MDLKKSKGEEVLYRGIQSASSQNEFQKEADDMVGRPTQFRTCEFERSKKCNRLGRGDQTGSSIDNFCNFHKRTRKKVYDDLGRGEQQSVIRRIRLPVESRSISPHCRENTTQKLPSCEDRNDERRPTKRKGKSLPELGLPTRHKTGFHQRELSQQPLGFRMLNRQQLELKAHEHLVTCNQRDMPQQERFERQFACQIQRVESAFGAWIQNV